MKILHIISFILLFVFTSNYAQSVESSRSISSNHLQLEFESLYATHNVENLKVKSWDTPYSLIRIGLNSNLELHFGIPISKETHYENDHLTFSSHQIHHSEFGTTINLWKQSKSIPEAAVMYRAIIPAESIKLETIDHFISLNFSNILNQKFNLNYNIGLFSENKKPIYFYIVNITYTINLKTYSFVEFQSEIHDNNVDNNQINYGIGFKLSNALNLDLSLGHSINKEFFFAGGILIFNINLQKKSKQSKVTSIFKN